MFHCSILSSMIVTNKSIRIYIDRPRLISGTRIHIRIGYVYAMCVFVCGNKNFRLWKENREANELRES